MILPVNLNPYAKTYQFHALPLSALTAEDRGADMFAINNFIQVYYVDKWMNYSNIDHFALWPCVDAKQIDIVNFNSHDEFIQLLAESLREGRYIYTHVNERYIPHRNSYLNSEDFNHDILVHGYENDNLHVLGYCDNGQYRSTTASLDDFKKSIDNSAAAIFFKANRDYKKGLDMELNAILIKKYLQSRGTPFEKYKPEEMVFGISAFKRLYEDIKNKPDDKQLDIRFWDLLYQHKRLMYERICLFSALVEMEKMKTAYYYGVMEKSQLVKMLALKYVVQQEKKLSQVHKTKGSMIEITIELLDAEKYILEQFVAALEKYAYTSRL